MIALQWAWFGLGILSGGVLAWGFKSERRNRANYARQSIEVDKSESGSTAILTKDGNVAGYKFDLQWPKRERPNAFPLLSRDGKIEGYQNLEETDPHEQ